MSHLPFIEYINGDNVISRIFSADTLESDLKWHWDKEDRWIWANHETDWLFQFDNRLPQKFARFEIIYIPKGEIHRIIRGTGDLELKIIKQ